jgi:hypothetical protein
MALVYPKAEGKKSEHAELESLRAQPVRPRVEATRRWHNLNNGQQWGAQLVDAIFRARSDESKEALRALLNAGRFRKRSSVRAENPFSRSHCVALPKAFSVAYPINRHHSSPRVSAGAR